MLTSNERPTQFGETLTAQSASAAGGQGWRTVVTIRTGGSGDEIEAAWKDMPLSVVRERVTVGVLVCLWAVGLKLYYGFQHGKPVRSHCLAEAPDKWVGLRPLLKALIAGIKPGPQCFNRWQR